MWQQRQSLSVCIWFQDWAHLGPESTVPMHLQSRPFTHELFLDFYANWSLKFFVSMIHQVIWPSPGTLAAQARGVPDMSSISSISWIMRCAEIFWLCKFLLIFRMHASVSSSSQCVPGTTCSFRTVGGVTGIEADEKAALVNKSSGMSSLAASGAVFRGVSTSSSSSAFSSSPASSQLQRASAHWNCAPFDGMLIHSHAPYAP